MVILGTFRVSWVIDWYLLPFPELIPKTSTWLTSDATPSAILGDFNVSWITDICRPPFPELANLDNRSAREFFSLGTWMRLNVENDAFKIVTYLRYEASWKSLPWYSPVTYPVTSNESLFTNKLCAPNSLASNMPATKASYLTWLLLALNANLRACSINNQFGPSKMTLTTLPCVRIYGLKREGVHYLREVFEIFLKFNKILCKNPEQKWG